MRRERVSPPMGNGAQLPRWRRAATHRIALAKLTPNRFADARQLMPSSPTATTTGARKSTDKGPIPRRLRSGAPHESDFHRHGNSSRFNLTGYRSSARRSDDFGITAHGAVREVTL